MAEAILYAGPTLARARLIRPDLSLAGIELREPVRRGDLPRLGPGPGTAILADGLFHTALAVGHAEIRAALAAGWHVWGVSSMGAIRAAEMRGLGMRGFGTVFALYCREDIDFRDDEVALLHEDAPSYRELSEPLVHLRGALDELCAPADRDAIVAALERMWFGDRTMTAVQELLLESHPDAAERLLRGLDRHRVKALDLIALLEQRPWR